jgi:hypothetical protein
LPVNCGHHFLTREQMKIRTQFDWRDAAAQG